MTEQYQQKIKSILSSDKITLFLIIIFFTFFYSYLGWLRLANFYASNWDLGIIGQSLWTTTHGYILFETTNYAHSGATSFLIIHSTFIAVPLSYLYYLYSRPMFLLVLQALIVSLSSVPLYYIAKYVIKHKLLSFAVIIIFLLSVAILSAILYDFHWESFIPLEFLLFFYFYRKKNYNATILIFIFGCATLEVFPFLAAGLVLFDLINDRRLVDIRWSDKTTRTAIIFLFVAAVGFVIIRILQKVAVPYLVGLPPSINDVSTSTLSVFKISFTGNSLASSLSYWAILYFSFLFIPLFYPKHVFAVLPWLFSSIFVIPTFSISLGNQYAFLAIPGLMLGFIYGLKEMQTKWNSTYFITLSLIAASLLFLAVIPGGIVNLLNWHKFPILSVIMWSYWLIVLILHFTLQKIHFKEIRFHKLLNKAVYRKYLVLFFVLVLIVTNFLIGPLNPKNFEATSMPGYQIKYSNTNEISFVGNITNQLPESATILASDNLFPFVMNHDKAYSLRWTSINYSTLQFFPFNSTNLPEYLFLSSSQLHLVPLFISNAIFGTHKYGLLSYIYEQSHYPGSIYLLKLNYKGNVNLINAPQNNNMSIFLNYQNLLTGPDSILQSMNGSKYAKVITGPVGGYDVHSPVIWYGPYYDLLPGQYKVTVNLTGSPMKNITSYSGTVLHMNSNSFNGSYFYSTYVNSSQLEPGKWSTFTYFINVTNPYPAEFRGYYTFTSSGIPAWSITLNYIQIQRI